MARGGGSTDRDTSSLAVGPSGGPARRCGRDDGWLRDARPRRRRRARLPARPRHADAAAPRRAGPHRRARRCARDGGRGRGQDRWRSPAARRDRRRRGAVRDRRTDLLRDAAQAEPGRCRRSASSRTAGDRRGRGHHRRHPDARARARSGSMAGRVGRPAVAALTHGRRDPAPGCGTRRRRARHRADAPEPRARSRTDRERGARHGPLRASRS